MDPNQRRSGRFSVETDSTIRDIWQYSQSQQAGSFDPQSMNENLDFRRQIRKETRPSDRFSLGKLLNADSPEVRQEEVSRAMRRKSANVNLQKSLQLLDEAVGTPAPLLRSAKKTPRSTHKHQMHMMGSSFPQMEMSSLSSMTPGRSMLATPGSTMASMSDSQMEMSLPVMTPRASMMERSAMADLGEDVTTTNVALLLEDDPGLAASNSLFGDFMESLQSHGSEHQIFQLLEEYENICTEQVTILKKLIRRATPGQNKFLKVKTTAEHLNDEKCTWWLISSLYKDRLETEVRGTEDEPMVVDLLGKNLSEKQLVQHLYEKDSSVRQGQLVVDWLEKMAEEELQTFYDRVEYFTDQAGAWENTLHSLQQKDKKVPFGSERPLVDEMDPDAPVRQKRPLADLDQEDEMRMLRYLFACIRAGQLDKAQKLCVKCGQAWRAATLEGWRLFHDANFDSVGSGGHVEPVEGNPCRDIWKTVCWRLAEDDLLHIYERAMYAALSGNLKQLLPVCDTWADYVWAYFKVMVDTRVEQEIRINSTSDKLLEELPKSYWDKIMSMDSIFKEIQASSNEAVRSSSKQKFQTIQKYIILGDIDALIEEMYEWVKDDIHPPSKHLVRFMAHLVLFFRTVGISTKEELCVTILEAYVRDLIEDQRTSMVAMFVSKLPQNLQIEWYARFLEGVQDTEERKRCLSLASEAGLDIPNITKLVVENIRSRDRTDFSMDTEMALDSGISEDDSQKIEAIDWLVFDPSQRAEAMRQANAVMRTFLAMKKHGAARAVFNKIPVGSIDVIVKTWQIHTGSTELSAEDGNAIREYLCIQAYLDAQDSFNDWFEHYHNAKPAQPDIPHSSNFTERVAYEHKEKQYHSDLDRWKHSLMLQTKTTTEKIYNVLLFVDGGWMVDQRKDGLADDGRSHQMALLRQMCLPAMTFLLHKVLHTTGQYKECMQLADTIASEQHALYTIFNKDELQKLLQRLRESSVELLNKNIDPLGYELS